MTGGNAANDRLLAKLTAGGRTYTLVRASASQVDAIVKLIRDDPISSKRETGKEQAYLEAFAQIDSDPAQTLVAVLDSTGNVVGTMQLTLIPGLSRGGMKRLHIEAVRVAPTERGSGLGTALFQWAADFGRAQGAGLAQLTTDKQRVDAHRFYERLGYAASHEGMKLRLYPPRQPRIT